MKNFHRRAEVEYFDIDDGGLDANLSHVYY